ncbi:MAG TPA: phosphoribosylformylglycinamidine cyclo-ligase, partial [Firmicutes bacterium]|nr:phosphoribosylformylglycinamidine cyclo-ligase [Bacillota bacterium]
NEVNMDLGRTVGEELLRPTKIYVRPVLKALERFSIRGMAHITGGGLPGNLPRILPPGLKAVIREGTWPVPPVFALIEKLGPVKREEMYRVFNMGVGFVLVSAEKEASALADYFKCQDVDAYLIGKIEKGIKKFELK